jgi:hypothetical protein
VSGPPVWARGDEVLETCPKSYITPESQTLLEEFMMRHRLGGLALSELTARQADAFFVLHRLCGEMEHGQQNTRRTA